MVVFPAVDIQDGRCVRLVQGEPDTAQTYYQQPWRAARHWEELGAEALHVVDLDGALPESSENREALHGILQNVSIPIEAGGGLRSHEAVEAILDQGVTRAVVGTRAATDPEWAITLCQRRPGRIVIALDARDGIVTIRGWQESSGLGMKELALRLAEGEPAAFLYTDVARDGMLTRPNFRGVEQLIEATPVPVIASGGVSSADDIRRLAQCGADGVITGKALYEGAVELPEALEIAAQHSSRLSPAPLR